MACEWMRKKIRKKNNSLKKFAIFSNFVCCLDIINKGKLHKFEITKHNYYYRTFKNQFKKFEKQQKCSSWHIYEDSD